MKQPSQPNPHSSQFSAHQSSWCRQPMTACFLKLAGRANPWSSFRRLHKRSADTHPIRHGYLCPRFGAWFMSIWKTLSGCSVVYDSISLYSYILLSWIQRSFVYWAAWAPSSDPRLRLQLRGNYASAEHGQTPRRLFKLKLPFQVDDRWMQTITTGTCLLIPLALDIIIVD